MPKSPNPSDIKLPPAWSFVCVYTRQRDGKRFEKTIYGPDKGRCEGCLKVVTINPPDEAEKHVCEKWWET